MTINWNQPYYWSFSDNALRNGYGFEEVPACKRRSVVQQRLAHHVVLRMKNLPAGWTFEWRRRRRLDFRMEAGRKVIKVPMPKTYAGVTLMEAGVWLAKQVQMAVLNSASDSFKRPPVCFIHAWGLPATHKWVRYPNYFGYGPASARLHTPERGSRYRRGFKIANISTVREILRWMSSPEAWTPRRKSSADPVFLGRDLLRVVAYRKLLLDYLRINETQHTPLPKRANLLLKQYADPLAEDAS
jgi:hypothetical protein